MTTKAVAADTGRRPSIRVEDAAQIAKLLRSGCTLKDAALVAGINSRTITRWRERGRIENERIDAATTVKARAPKASEVAYLEFWQETERARTRRKVLALTTIQDLMGVAHDDRIRLQAATFYLERGFPDEWAKRDRDPAREPATDDEQGASDDRARREAVAALDELEQRRKDKTG